MRSSVVVSLLAALTALIAAAPAATTGQDKKAEAKQPPAFDPPKVTKPAGEALAQIQEKTEQLRKAVAGLTGKAPDDVVIEIAVFLKAAEYVVRYEEWYGPDSGKWVLAALEEGLARAKQLGGGRAAWRDAPGKWVVRAYRSEIDGSIQPYAVLLPRDYGKDPKRRWRLDIVLHGRDAALTEARFIATHAGAAPEEQGYVQLDVYGRGNNAYRWAGETDVFEARDALMRSAPDAIDRNRVVLRGFSMGGAGTWHIGLHHPSEFCVIGPGAGFTATHGYVGSLPKELPPHQEKCLSIYDAVDYAENAFGVPVVAYSGENDPQKQAADNIERALKSFKEPVRFTSLVAPGVGHQMPKEWRDRAEAEYKKYAETGRNATPNRVRFVTYTPQYGTCNWVTVRALDETYTRAVIDAEYANKTFVVKTTNVRRFDLKDHPGASGVSEVTIDGTKVPCLRSAEQTVFEKRGGTWGVTRLADAVSTRFRPDKRGSLQGPIDDAFRSSFRVIKPSKKEGYSAAVDRYTAGAADQFSAVWDRYFRGALPLATTEKDLPRYPRCNAVLFGDPRSNPVLGKVIDKTPITWTPTRLVMNGVEYDAQTHIPVFIYPNPLDNASYVVVNSGHTFGEADLKGTNALLYPRLGDWAVVKLAPAGKDPTAVEVVAAGLFDENWLFAKKK